MTENIRWSDAKTFKKSLAANGWKTPDTYCNSFSTPVKGPAVYLFLVHGWDVKDDYHDFDKALVAYAGMSKRLDKRWSNHEILKVIADTGRYVQRWFFPAPSDDLRELELLLIQKFDPPWNIQGRTRGDLI